MNNSFLSLKCRFVSHVVLLRNAIPTIFAITAAMLWLILNPCFADNDYNQELEEQAKDYITELATQEIEPNEKIEIEMGSITTGSDYKICEGELDFEVASGKVRRNNTIKITCHSKTTPYYFYITAKITFLAPFVTVIDAVPKGAVLSLENLTIDYMNKTLDRGMAFTDPSLLNGVHTKRDLRPGAPIAKNQICVVCRGDEVSIEAGSNLLNVTTKGEALQDGSYNDKIRVKNQKSGKVIRGTIIDNETVRIE